MIKLKFNVVETNQWIIKAKCIFTSFILDHSSPLNVSDYTALLFKKAAIFEIISDK